MILFKNGFVVDGSGDKPFKADVLVDGERIIGIYKTGYNSEFGTLKSADVYDINGCILSPGFIDCHAHSELEVLRHPAMPYKIMQGITTDLSGNCGVGVYPKHRSASNLFPDILGHYDNPWNWSDFSSFKNTIKTGMNIGFLQPHANLRLMAIEGNPNREATPKEIDMMCSLLDKSLEQGCFGFSSGIYYAPNIYASKDEYIELLKIVRHHNKVFSVHHRCEGTEIISSIKEVLGFAKETGVQLEISHLKVIGKHNQDKLEDVLKLIEEARCDGVNVSFDSYPYEYGSTSLFSLLPPDYLQLDKATLLEKLKEASLSTDSEIYKDLLGKITNPVGWDSIVDLCGPENITAVILENNPEFNGLTLTECAKKLNTDVYTALFKLLSEETGAALMADITQSKENLLMVARHPLCSFGTDALYVGGGSHPRSGSAAVHYLKMNVYDTKNLTLETAIHKMTGLNALRFGFKERGFVRTGYYADLVVFNLKSLSDNATLSEPFIAPSGISYVLVNGEFSLFKGERTGSTSGKVLIS